MWGEELEKEEDVFHVFECYITGMKNRNGVKVGVVLWVEPSGQSLIFICLVLRTDTLVLTSSQSQTQNQPSVDHFQYQILYWK